MASLADIGRWTDEALAVATAKVGWGEPDAGRVAIDEDHTVVVAEIAHSDGHEWAYVAAARFHEPDEDDDPEDDELAGETDSSPCWALTPDADRVEFDRAWERQRDAVAAALGREPVLSVLDEDGSWVALWPVGDHALAVAQTEDFDSYSLFDMVALWVCRRPAAGDGPPAGADYPWLTDFPGFLARFTDR